MNDKYSDWKSSIESISCVECNYPVLVEQQIPQEISEEAKKFFICPKCGRHHFFNKKGELI